MLYLSGLVIKEFLASLELGLDVPVRKTNWAVNIVIHTVVLSLGLLPPCQRCLPQFLPE
jgi:hypothetical protein